MAFKEILQEKLKEEISSEKLDVLPSGFQRIGDIIILNLNKKLQKHKKIIGAVVIKLFPNVKTILNKKAGITGKFRKPQLEILAGSKNTETINQEHGCFYKFDVHRIMWAKGNVNERARIAKVVKPDEIIVDMFAGIGYFTIPIAKLAKPKIVYAIELNPVAYKYLLENIRLNRVQGKVNAIHGNCMQEAKKIASAGIKADRIIMGILPSAKKYLPAAKLMSKQGTIIHYEGVGENTEKLIQEIRKIFPKARILHEEKVKAYAPKRWHFTIDFQL